MTISMVADRNIVFHGSVSGSFVMGGVVNGKPMGASISQGKVVVGVALSEAPAVKIKGSGDVTLLVCSKRAWTWKSKAQATSPPMGKSHTWKSKSPAPVM